MDKTQSLVWNIPSQRDIIDSDLVKANKEDNNGENASCNGTRKSDSFWLIEDYNFFPKNYGQNRQRARKNSTNYGLNCQKSQKNYGPNCQNQRKITKKLWAIIYGQNFKKTTKKITHIMAKIAKNHENIARNNQK